MDTPLAELKNLILRIADVEDIKKAVGKALSSEVGSDEVFNSLGEALEEVGKKYERGEYFLSELMMVGLLATEIVEMVKPHQDRSTKTLGKVIIGTVKGDIHDIGKNIVIMMLQAARFEVIDLGIDIPAERFVEAVENEDAAVLGMSALLVSTVDEMKNVMEELEKKGLRDKVRVVVGGRPVTKEFAEDIGADGYAEDAIEAVKVVKGLVKE